ncbi:M24 family metallopeptidase [Candidatus Woesearchaeota archaeon]|nr:M24 family metallopeptidase [Candidatus Woesearchaeota archaeon]
MIKRDKYTSLKQACAINDRIFSEIVKHFTFRTEQEVALYIRKRFRDFGVKPAYPSIVANNCMNIHPKPRKKRFQHGFLILDFGAKVNGYCSDMTRTLFLGKATKEEKQLYDLIRSCQQKSIRHVKTGMLGCDLDLYARTLLEDYKPYFKHALGHGVSKKIHDKPLVSVTSADVLKEGDFLTIEPGIYFKKQGKEVGIRIEDTLYVGRNIEVLCKSQKHFICLPIK